jgi:hypothetical protein
MNRRRHDESKSHAAAFTALFLMVVVGAGGGAMHAIYRNGQIKAEREIVKTHEAIDQLRLDIQMIQVRKERELDRYEIRSQLALHHSALVAVGHGDIEKVQPLGGPETPPVALRP